MGSTSLPSTVPHPDKVWVRVRLGLGLRSGWVWSVGLGLGSGSRGEIVGVEVGAVVKVFAKQLRQWSRQAQRQISDYDNTLTLSSKQQN